MNDFAANLASLPPVEHLRALDLIDEEGRVIATIENRPGQSGSLRIYHAVAKRHGGIDGEAAHEALRLYGEHVADARAEPGRHPNIDRLFTVIAEGSGYGVRLHEQGTTP